MKGTLTCSILAMLAVLSAASNVTYSTATEYLHNNTDCSFFVKALKAANLSSTVHALNGTILVPTDEAFARAMRMMNVTEQDMLAHPDAAAALLLYHMAPFVHHNMSHSSPLQVALLNKTLKVEQADAGISTTVAGDYNAARIIATEYIGGKEDPMSIVHIVDAVLIPDIPTHTNATSGAMDKPCNGTRNGNMASAMTKPCNGTRMAKVFSAAVLSDVELASSGSSSEASSTQSSELPFVGPTVGSLVAVMLLIAAMVIAVLKTSNSHRQQALSTADLFASDKPAFAIIGQQYARLGGSPV